MLALYLRQGYPLFMVRNINGKYKIPNVQRALGKTKRNLTLDSSSTYPKLMVIRAKG
jgi:hypothetical protein